MTYATGTCWMAGGKEARGIARWNGHSWSPVGKGFGGEYPYGTALSVFHDGGREAALYAAGSFTFAGGVSSQGIAKLVGCAGVVFGDLNGDGMANVTDMLLLLESWGPCPDPPVTCPADLDRDGLIGINDLLLLFANWTGP